MFTENTYQIEIDCDYRNSIGFVFKKIYKLDFFENTKGFKTKVVLFIKFIEMTEIELVGGKVLHIPYSYTTKEYEIEQIHEFKYFKACALAKKELIGDSAIEAALSFVPKIYINNQPFDSSNTNWFITL